MGGFGSTRWGDHTKKAVVEDCFGFPVSCLPPEALRYPHGQHGLVVVRPPDDSQRRVMFGWALVRGLRGATVLHLVRPLRATQYAETEIEVDTRPDSLGRVRPRFRCPGILRGGRTCGRLVTTVFAKTVDGPIGCRHCLQLTYRSVQAHDARVDAILGSTDPDEVSTLFALASSGLQAKTLAQSQRMFRRAYEGRWKATPIVLPSAEPYLEPMPGLACAGSGLLDGIEWLLPTDPFSG